jgi:S-adenosyl methyltransferase
MHRPPAQNIVPPMNLAAHCASRPWTAQPTTQDAPTAWQQCPDHLPGDHHQQWARLGSSLTCNDASSRSILLELTCISHLTADFAPDQVSSGVAAYNTLVPAGITARSHAGVTALLGGLSLVAPGVVPVPEWRPDAGRWSGQPADLYAGLATVGRRSR